MDDVRVGIMNAQKYLEIIRLVIIHRTRQFVAQFVYMHYKPPSLRANTVSTELEVNNAMHHSFHLLVLLNPTE